MKHSAFRMFVWGLEFVLLFLFLLSALSADVYAGRRGDSQTRSYNGAFRNGQSVPAQNVSFSRETESVRSYKQLYQLYSESRTVADKTQKFAELLKLADSILDQPETEDYIFAQTCEIKGRVLAEKAGADRQEFQPYLDYVAWLESDRRASVQPELRESCLSFRSYAFLYQVALYASDSDPIEKVKTLLQEVKQFVLRNPDRAELVLKLIDPVMKVAQKNGTVSGSDLFGNFGESLYKSNDPRLYPIALKLCNTLNFQSLPGNAMFLEGTFSNGKQFDREQNKNKVVLVYFWATWCTACHSIYPEINALYNRYHQKGLEVFVYSLDRDVNALKLYEQQQKLPWPVVSEHLSIQNGQKKLSEHYGISLIPTLVLIDRNGKVIRTDIKTPALAQELEKIFEIGEE